MVKKGRLDDYVSLCDNFRHELNLAFDKEDDGLLPNSDPPSGAVCDKYLEQLEDANQSISRSHERFVNSGLSKDSSEDMKLVIALFSALTNIWTEFTKSSNISVELQIIPKSISKFMKFFSQLCSCEYYSVRVYWLQSMVELDAEEEVVVDGLIDSLYALSDAVTLMRRILVTLESLEGTESSKESTHLFIRKWQSLIRFGHGSLSLMTTLLDVTSSSTFPTNELLKGIEFASTSCDSRTSVVPMRQSDFMYGWMSADVVGDASLMRLAFGRSTSSVGEPEVLKRRESIVKFET